MISESSDHSRIAALTCIEIVIQEVGRRISFSEDILWSDGWASQLFQILANYCSNLIIRYYNNKAHHDKNSLDGIGGTIKNVVFRQVESGKVVINSPKEFCDAANRFVSSISMLSQKGKNTLLCELDFESSKTSHIKNVTWYGENWFLFPFKWKIAMIYAKVFVD